MMKMSRNRTFRPRISRDQRDRVLEHAERLNGTEPEHGFHHGVELLTRYIDVLYEEIDECPDCGGATISTDKPIRSKNKRITLPAGTYRCESCRSTFSALEYMDVAHPEEAELPALPRSQRGEEGNTGRGDPGSNATDSRSRNPPGNW